MTVYSVYEPPSGADEIEHRANGLVFVKEGFSWPALLVPGVWLLYRRMWLESAAFAALIVLLGWLCGGSDAGKSLFGWMSLGLIVLFAFEANDLRIGALERRGYKLAGIATGKTRDDAELDFFRAWLPGQSRSGGSDAGARSRQVPVVLPRSGEGDGVIGLFPQA